MRWRGGDWIKTIAANLGIEVGLLIAAALLFWVFSRFF